MSEPSVTMAQLSHFISSVKGKVEILSGVLPDKIRPDLDTAGLAIIME